MKKFFWNFCLSLIATSAAYAADTTPPVVTFVGALPPAYSSQHTFTVNYTITDDSPFTVYCQVSSGSVSSCTNTSATFTITNEGQQSINITAIDSANNDSAPQTAAWVADWTAPSVVLQSTPPASTPNTSATFQFSVGDGSPVQAYCSLDGVQSACQSPVSYTGLSTGSHDFELVVVDAAGNQTALPPYNWTITTPPPTSVNLAFLGVRAQGSGSTDQTVDMYLGRNGTPYIYWSSNISTLTYNITIKKTGSNSAVCSLKNVQISTDASQVAGVGFSSSCKLKNNIRYDVVISGSASGGLNGSTTGQFLTDLNVPCITAYRTNNSGSSPAFYVKMTDAESGIGARTCRVLKGNSVVKTVPCSNDGTVTVTGLSKGRYTFQAIGTDRAQNTKTQAVNFSL